MNKKLALGVFVSFFLLVFLSFLFFLGNFSIGKYYTFDIVFTDVSGLPEKATVKMNGVKVGKVVSINLYQGQAKVRVKISGEVDIPNNSTFSIMATGVVGSKYLDVRPKISNVVEYDPVFIKEGDSVRGIAPYSMNEVLDQLMRVVNEFTVNGNLQESPIFRAINNLEQITDKMNKGLGRDEEDFREIIVNIRESTKYLRNIGADINDLIKENKGKLNKDLDKLSYVMDNAKEISDKLNSASDKINVFLDNVNEGEGTISSLVGDENMAKELKATVNNVKQATADIKKITGNISKIDVSWDMDLRYNQRNSQMRTDVGFIIEPRDDKRYLISVDNIGADKPSRFDKGNQKYNTITALAEKDFGKFTVHAGSIKSSGGIGAAYRPFNKVSFRLDAYRFDRENDENKQVMWLDSFVAYQLNKWTDIRIGTEDILESPGFTTAINITVLDEDISYLFGLAGFASLN
ncbi:MAG: MCE family protein [bacterium]|nr:MCE family protein [bacterium]